MGDDFDDLVEAFDLVEHARLRPGMYVGGTGKKALHALVDVLIDESICQIQLGRCNKVWITLQPENQIQIRDNGPGFPVEVIEPYKKSMLEIIMTRSGTYRTMHGTYKFRRSFWGLVLVAVNALSAELTAEVARDGYLWRQTYREGRPQNAVVQVRKLEAGESTGTTITFKPDFTILEKNEFDYQLLCARAYELAMLLKQATFTVRDERVEPPPETVYHFENGLIDHIRDLRGDEVALHPPIHMRREVYFPDKDRTISAEFAFQYLDSDVNQVVSYVNTVRTEGGTHETGFYKALSQSLSHHPYNRQLPQGLSAPLTQEQVKLGLLAVVHVLHPFPDFGSQAYFKLLNPEVEKLVEDAASEAFASFAQENPDVLQRIVERCLKRNVG